MSEMFAADAPFDDAFHMWQLRVLRTRLHVFGRFLCRPTTSCWNTFAHQNPTDWVRRVSSTETEHKIAGWMWAVDGENQ